MASNSDSPTRSRSKHKHTRNDKMEMETTTKEDALERSIEEIRFKMKEKRRKKVQADLSLSRSRHKNANLVLKASLRQNNRTLAKSLEVTRNEYRHAQNDLVELQRERHLLQSVVNRFQDQHAKQRNQIKGVHQVLRKVTSSLMDTVGLLGQAMDMCVIPRHTKDRSLGLVFRTSSSLTSDDLSDSEPKDEGGSTPAEMSMLSVIPRRIPANKEIINQLPVGNNPNMEEIEDLPDIDIPLMFMSHKIAPQGKERTRRDTRNLSAGNQKLSRRTSSLLDAATIAAVATEIEKSAENIRTVVEETVDGQISDEGQASICIDENESVQDDNEMDEFRSLEENHDRQVTKKRSRRPSLRKAAEVFEHGHSEEMEEGDVSCMGKEDRTQLDDGSQGIVGKRRSGRLSKKRITYVYPDDDDEITEKDDDDEITEKNDDHEITEKDECMELAPKDEEIVGRSSDGRDSTKRSGRLSRRRGTFVKEDGDLKTFRTDNDLQEIEILDDDDDEEAIDSSKVGDLNQQEDGAEEAIVEIPPKGNTYKSDEGAAEIAEQLSEKTHKKHKKKHDKRVKKIIAEDADRVHESADEGLMVTDQHEAAGDAEDDKHEQKLPLNSIPDHRTGRVIDENSAEKSDYRIMDMELTAAAIGHISIIEGADPQTKSHKNNVVGGTERSPTSKLDLPSSNGEPSQTERSAVPCKEKPKSRLPVLMKSKLKTSKLKKSAHKSQSRMGTSKDSKKRRDEKDVLQTTVFDLSMGDSFSHPTPPRLITKPRATTVSNTDEAVEKDSEVYQSTTDRGSGDELEKVAQIEPSHDKELEAFANQEFDTLGKERERDGKEKHSKIKRKSRKAKSVVTPVAAEPKVRLSEKALLEELSNLDASYLNDVTNPERKSKIGASFPSRKSSQKDVGESLSDLMVRPHHRKTSKRKLSKRNFYFGETENEDDQRQSRIERKSEARTSEINTSALNTSSLNPDKPNPDSTSPTPKTSSSSLNTTIDILEDLENILMEVDEPKKSKKILKPSGQSSRGASNLNVTFVKDDMCDFEAVKKDKVSKTTQNPETGTTKTSKAKNLKQESRKTFVVEDAAKTFFGNLDDSELQDKDEAGSEVNNEISDMTETQTSKRLTTELVQSSLGNHTSTVGSRTGNEDVLEALGRSSSIPHDDQLDEPEANKNREAEEPKTKRKVKGGDGDILDVISPDIAEKTNLKHLTTEPVQPSQRDNAPRCANDDEVETLDRSPSKTRDNQPDESEPRRKEVEEKKKGVKAKKINKRKAKTDDDDEDDDILDGMPSKVAKGDVESVTEVPERRGRRSKAVSYKEPSAKSKLRQGDPNTFTLYKGVPGKTSKKQEQARSPLSTIAN